VVNLYVGITDPDWFAYLSQRPAWDEVNFWAPSGRTQFRAIQPGELFLFKLHAPDNFIVGGGVLGHASILPVSLAWEAFGDKNGGASLAIIRTRLAHYRQVDDDPRNDYLIGCRLIEQPFFLPRDRWIPMSFKPGTQVGKKFTTADESGLALWSAVQAALAGLSLPSQVVDAARYGTPRLIPPRLGQGTFRIAVTDAYERKCAITGEKTLPALDASHIREYAAGGSHDVSNGILFRSDIHRLFDRGYVTVDEIGRFVVSRRIKEDFENGRDYYRHHGEPIRPTKLEAHLPDRKALQWHREERFLA
jgi:putative restriction endonuclease